MHFFKNIVHEVLSIPKTPKSLAFGLWRSPNAKFSGVLGITHVLAR